MRTILFFFCLICASQPSYGQSKTLYSPNKSLVVAFKVDQNGTPSYSISLKGKKIIRDSKLGLLTSLQDFSQNLTLTHSQIYQVDSTWSPVLGQEESIRDHHNGLILELTSPSKDKIKIHFKAFDNGVGFRYELEKQEKDSVTVTNELTEFQLTENYTTWWAPSDWDSNEHTYTQSLLSEIDATKHLTDIEPFNQYIPDIHAVQTPVAFRSPKGLHLTIAEAALVNYGALHLSVDRNKLLLKATIVPSASSATIAKSTLPFHTPWRVVLIDQSASSLLKNRTILNLNDPCKISGDLSWIKPTKYVGVWWEMHVGKGSWNYADKSGQPSGTHAANTSNVKRYIDFASKYGFNGVLVEGWNTGWEDWFNSGKEEVFNFTQPYPDYNIQKLTDYATSKGVKIIMHHETSGAVPSYERQMDTAFQYMKKYQMDAVKTGYVGYLFPKKEWHDGQWFNNHLARVAQKAANYKIMVNAHESSRPSGLQRTWPNWIANEAARGMEYNAWSKGNNPSHVLTLPFTRLLGGPMDYTPGIFETRMNTYDPNKKEFIQSTVANQLALYVTMYSPLQMAADLPENYEKRLDVFQFIRDVPADWSESTVLNAKIGDYLTIARREKKSDNWFIGSITDETSRSFKIKLDFLNPTKTYEATIYEDGANAHYIDNPYPVTITKKIVRKGDTITIHLAPGGGTAISLSAK